MGKKCTRTTFHYLVYCRKTVASFLSFFFTLFFSFYCTQKGIAEYWGWWRGSFGARKQYLTLYDRRVLRRRGVRLSLLRVVSSSHALLSAKGPSLSLWPLPFRLGTRLLGYKLSFVCTNAVLAAPGYGRLINFPRSATDPFARWFNYVWNDTERKIGSKVRICALFFVDCSVLVEEKGMVNRNKGNRLVIRCI